MYTSLTYLSYKKDPEGSSMSFVYVSDYSWSIASTGHTAAQEPQSIQASASIS